MARKNLLKGFKTPKGITFEHIETNSDYGKFTAYPFEPGFGTTVGNTLRRVLLSSIQGYAVTSVRITSYDADDVPHVISSEFETIPNVAEDTLEVLNNIKQVRFKMPDDITQETFEFEFTGPGVVTSDMLVQGSQLEVMSKNKHIFTMMENAHLLFQMQVDLNRGYIPAEQNEHNIDIVGTIPVDAIFTPITKVKYVIEPCRVGQRNDYDKLVMEIWTDGSIAPDDALAEAGKIAKDHFSIFINFNDGELDRSDEIDEGDERVKRLLAMPVSVLELSVRSTNCLQNASIQTIGELTRKTEDEIAKTRNFGKVSLEEIKGKLLEMQLNLGMTDYSHLKNAVNLLQKKENKDES